MFVVAPYDMGSFYRQGAVDQSDDSGTTRCGCNHHNPQKSDDYKALKIMDDAYKANPLPDGFGLSCCIIFIFIPIVLATIIVVGFGKR